MKPHNHEWPENAEGRLQGHPTPLQAQEKLLQALSLPCTHGLCRLILPSPSHLLIIFPLSWQTFEMQEVFGTVSALCQGDVWGGCPRFRAEAEAVAVYLPVGFQWLAQNKELGKACSLSLKNPHPQHQGSGKRGRWNKWVSGVLALNKGLESTERELTQQISGFSLGCNYRGDFLSHTHSFPFQGVPGWWEKHWGCL